MYEAMSGAPTLLPQAVMVGQHLLRAVEKRNPLVQEPEDQFEAAVMVAEAVGSERAIEIAWETLDERAEPFNSPHYRNFAETLIKKRGAVGAIEANRLVGYMPEDEKDLMRPHILTMAAEAADDADTRAEASDKAELMLRTMLEQGSSELSIMCHPSDLLLRLGVVTQREYLVDTAVQALPSAIHKFDFMQEIAKGLKHAGEGSPLRSALVNAAVQAQKEGVAFPAAITRYGFRDLLTDAEMKALLAAVHGDGKQPLRSAVDTTFGSATTGICVSNGSEFAAFNKLASEYDTWPSFPEHVRFAAKAWGMRAMEAWRREGQPMVGRYGSAAYMAKTIMNALTAQPELPIDDILQYGSHQVKSPEHRLHSLWSYGVIPHVKNGDFQRADIRDIVGIYTLRDELPYLSAARIKLNAALANSGDRTALLNSAHALTREEGGLLSRPVKHEGAATGERRINLSPYKWDFFSPALEQ